MIKMASPSFGPEALRQINDVLATGQLVQGELVSQFEDSISEVVGAANVIAVSSGTSALELALRALGVGSGSKVVVPAYSFVATANVVHTIGALPVFVDVVGANLTMDASRALEACSLPGVDAILPVHEFGFAADIQGLMTARSAHGVPVVEDAACALGSSADPAIGSMSDAWCYSLHPRKVLTTGEGGLICTAESDLAVTLRLLRNHGLASGPGGLDCVMPGLNARMTELQAALGLAQLRSLHKSLRRRRILADRYLAGLSGQSGLRLFPNDAGANWQTFLIRYPNSATRDFAMMRLREHGIESSVGAQCIPAMSFYRGGMSDHEIEERFPNAWDAWTTGVAIPLHEGLKDGDIDQVVEVLLDVEVLA